LNLDKVLEKLIGHKVVLHHTQHEEPEMRETSGILRDFNRDMIHMTIYNVYGEKTEWYLNRHACTLLSITDEGSAVK
jgi:hypothetical protein